MEIGGGEGIVERERAVERLQRLASAAQTVERGADFHVRLGPAGVETERGFEAFQRTVGLAGLRIGYGIAAPELAAALEKIRQPFNANLLAQTAALAALDDDEHVKKTRSNNFGGLEFFAAAFKKLDLEFVPSFANFILVRVGAGQKVFEAMQKLGVITRPMGGYQLPEWIRISVGTPKENERCLAALKTALGR